MANGQGGQFCPHCGVKCEAADRFCSECGSKLVTGDSATGQRSDKGGAEEAGAIAAEMCDAETFFALCQGRPEEALRKISKLESCAPEMGKNASLMLFRAIAFANKALKAHVHGGELTDAKGQEECELALSELLRASEALKSERMGSVAEELRPKIDEVAIVLEKAAAGRVQELLGTAKLKYIAFADRVKLSGNVESALTPDELREAMELPIKVPFIIRSALLATVMEISGQKLLMVMLYEQKDIWAPTGKMNPIKGQLQLRKSDTPSGQWHIS